MVPKVGASGGTGSKATLHGVMSNGDPFEFDLDPPDDTTALVGSQVRNDDWFSFLICTARYLSIDKYVVSQACMYVCARWESGTFGLSYESKGQNLQMRETQLPL